MLPSDKRDAIHNALLVGMSLEDAYLYAGCTPNEIALDKEDHESQTNWQQVRSELEFSLLNDMSRVSSKQIAMGRSDALQWRLEKFFPRYSSKPQPEVGKITLVINKGDAEDITEVFKPKQNSE